MRIFTRRLSTSSRRLFERKNIETVCPRIHEYLFPNIPVPPTASLDAFHGQLPSLKGNNLQEHFERIAKEQTEPYFALLEKAQRFDVERAKDCLRKLEGDWRFATGWTRYSFDGQVESVDAPREAVLFFDIELVVRDGNLPTLAVALAEDAWYGWCSERLVDGCEVPAWPTAHDLIRIGEVGGEKVVIGHNVGFDRARVAEAYERRETRIRFMDTMSMAIPMFGMADHQQSIYEMFDVEESEEKTEWMNAWKGRVSKNSLIAVHDHLYPGKEISAEGFSKKTLRANFVKDPIEKIRDDFQPLMSYCARDNILCAEIYRRLWAEFKQRFPSRATLVGMLNMGNVYLPINNHWRLFYAKNDGECEAKKTQAARAIVRTARKLMDGAEKDDDLWMWAHDWSEKKNGVEWFVRLFKARSHLGLPMEQLEHTHITLKSMLIPSMFGMVFDGFPLMKTRSKGWGFLAPGNAKNIQRHLEQDSFCLLQTDTRPDSQRRRFPLGKLLQMLASKDVSFLDERRGFQMDDNDLVRFYQLEHPNGDGNVGDPLTKHFAGQLKARRLSATRFDEQFEVVLDSLQTTQFWTSYSNRYNQEVAIWSRRGPSDGAIAAPVVPAGTVSRRSVHKLWVTLTNRQAENVIGTGIKSMVQAPHGWRLVGADVDSQEQWLAGLFGDASAEKRLPAEQRRAGVTAFSNMMLAGSKSDGTDLHSVVAQQLSIGRNDAKVLNYARLYGSGETHAAKHLMRVAGMKKADAEKTAKELFKLTKGEVTVFRKLDPLFNCFVDKYLKKMCNDDLKFLTINGQYYLPAYNSHYAKETIEFENWLLKHYGDHFEGTPEEKIIPNLYADYLDKKKLFVGGYESSTFNFLEVQADTENLRTPILECQLADSLGKLPDGTPDAKHFDKKYKRSVMNWIVQSSAVDFLHLLIVSMNWLCSEFQIDAKFVISIHDEVRYMCAEKDAPRLAYALQISHLLVRAFISQKCGIHQLPSTVAFFSQIDNDTVLRKEVDVESWNPDGTRIDDGIAWKMEDILRLTAGRI